MNYRTALNILIVLCLAVMLFHLLIVLRIVPYEITWGGRLKSVEEMHIFEFISIGVNSFFLFVLLQKGNYIRQFFGAKALTIILWLFFAIFTLNTIGNLFAETNFERSFTVLTLINALLILKVNGKILSDPAS